MHPDRKEYLNLHSKPGRVTSEEAGWHLGFGPHEISILIGAGVLQPLGNPADNGVKFFLSWELDQLNKDKAWFAKASNTIIKYWKDRNLQRATTNAIRRWPHRFTAKVTQAKPTKARAVRPKLPKTS